MNGENTESADNGKVPTKRVFFFKRNFKNNFEKIWKKEKGFLSLLHRNDYLFTFKNSREL